MGPRNLLYGGLSELDAFRKLHPNNQSNGLGLVTTAVCLAGLWLARGTPGVRMLVLATGTVMLAATMFGDFSAWRWVHAHVPGGSALRSIGRVGMIVLPLAVLGAAVGLDRCLGRWRGVAATALVLLIAAEQLHSVPLADKYVLRAYIDDVTARVDPDCEAFFMVCTEPTPSARTNDEAMWVALQAGKPTVNGHSGNNPPGWAMTWLLLRGTPESRTELRERLWLWCAQHGLDASRIQWIEVRGIEIEPFRHVLGVQATARS
ncbi:MAG: hypothetical protein ACYTG2_11125 [Planctomycetota bacterium]|jgi:hypothetical protein